MHTVFQSVLDPNQNRERDGGVEWETECGCLFASSRGFSQSRHIERKIIATSLVSKNA
jgi:hypothetical protein